MGEVTPVREVAGLAWIGSHPWLYPLLESLHIVGIGLLLGSLAVLEWRVWRRRDDPLAPEALARLALPITLAGFTLAGLSGVLMFASQPGELLANRAFALKLLLLTFAGGNAAIFHARQSLEKLDAVARWQTVASLGLWVAVIICGRWIAYR